MFYKSRSETAWDDVSNENRVPALVHAARALEMEYSHKLGVYEKAPREHRADTRGKIIGVRWVDVNKGDALDVNYRSRLLGPEFNVGCDDALLRIHPTIGSFGIFRELRSNSAVDWRKANDYDPRCTPSVLLR